MVTYVTVYSYGEETEIVYVGPDKDKAYSFLDFYHHVEHWENGERIHTESILSVEDKEK